jgi:ATP-dependent DNA ligase
VPSGPQWVYEIKHDGFRFICRRESDRMRVFSRNGRDWTDRAPLIAEAIAKLWVKSVTLDGEGVVCRPDGVSDFDRLRASVGRMGSRDAFLYAFNVLEIDGEDLRPYEWHVRRTTLRSAGRRCRAAAITIFAVRVPQRGSPSGKTALRWPDDRPAVLQPCPKAQLPASSRGKSKPFGECILARYAGP